MDKKKQKKGKIVGIVCLVVCLLLGILLLIYGKRWNEQLKKLLGTSVEETVDSYIIYPEKKKKTDQENTYLKVEYINQKQQGYPTGCESACAVMALRYAGIETDMKQFIKEYLKTAPVRWEEKKGKKEQRLVGPDPREAFAGDPSTEHGYGCELPVIYDGVSRLIKDRKKEVRAVDLSGQELSSIVEKYIDQKIPLLAWVTNRMEPVAEGTRWLIKEQHREYVWKKGEHCILILGYDKENYYYHDPVYGEYLSETREKLENAYGYMGKQAMVIR